MLVNSDSSPHAKGCTSKFQNFVRLGNCSRIDHNKSQAEESGSHAHRISADPRNVVGGYVPWSVIGVYTSAVDSECVVRSLRERGCDGAVVTEARLNAETETGAALLQEPG